MFSGVVATSYVVAINKEGFRDTRHVLRLVAEGERLGEGSNVTVILENIFDKNYRTMGSGVDAPGLNTIAGFPHRF